MEHKEKISNEPAIQMNHEILNPEKKQQKHQPSKRRIIRKRPKAERKTKVTRRSQISKKHKKRNPFQQATPKQPGQEQQNIEKSSQFKQDMGISEVSDEEIENKNTQIIEFDPSVLPENIQRLYNLKEKLKNTDLMIPGTKYSKDPNWEYLKKWQSALVVYQKTYRSKNSPRIHFGLMLKHGDRVITFDGVPKLWPIRQVEKSYHWTPQNDTWSCGYQVLFWVQKIKSVGVKEWVEKYQIRREFKQEQKLEA